MEQNEIRKLLQNVANGDILVDDALLHIKNEPFEDLGYAKPDFHRKSRQGVSEVIYGAGKTAEQIIGISKSFAEHGQKDILITRLDKAKAEKINKEIPLDYYDMANIGIIGSMPKERVGKIVIATGGTSDIPIAEEAAITAEMLGNNTVRLYDVGVAGIPQIAYAYGRNNDRSCCYCDCGNGGCTCKCYRRTCGLPCYSCADKCGLRCVFRRYSGTFVDA